MLLTTLLCILSFAVAGAQEPPPAEPDRSALPTLAWAPPVRWPQEALAAGGEGWVRLRLQVDAAGRVVDSELLAISSRAFEEVMGEVLDELRFHPARDEGGRAVPALIEYVHRFTLDTAPTVAIGGRVRLSGSETDLAGVQIEARAPALPAQAPILVQSAADGSFELFDLLPGRWILVGTAPGLRSDELEVEVKPGERVEVRLFLAELRQDLTGEASEAMTVYGDRMEPELTVRRLDAASVRFLPGSGGDVVRAVQTQPGVARTPFNSGTLLVRGTPADATAFDLGGTRIPLIFHFGGLSTAVNGDLLEELRFLPGSYGTRYGRRMGGLVELVPRSSPIQESAGYASLDLLQTTLMHDQVIGPRTSLSFSVRRSYFDLLLSPLVNIDPSWTVRLPGYTDAQLHLLHETQAGGVFSSMLLASEDHFSFTALTEGGAPEVSRLDLRFFRAWASWTRPLGKAWELELTGMLGPERTVATLEDEEQAREQATRGQARLELNRPVLAGGSFGWRLGLDLELAIDEVFAYNTSELGGFYLYAEDEAG